MRLHFVAFRLKKNFEYFFARKFVGGDATRRRRRHGFPPQELAPAQVPAGDWKALRHLDSLGKLLDIIVQKEPQPSLNRVIILSTTSKDQGSQLLTL